ncbi:MAG: class I SAM-dependent methyltransferase [Acidimicrobiia bacterium]|nr:class I SAM-dependent methyltransferase [Acidimicrobiia bacterium]
MNRWQSYGRRIRGSMAGTLQSASDAIRPSRSSTELRRKVGGLWNEMGSLQLNFLIEHGLTPESYFLDVGCGVLRAGRHFVRHLDDGHYCGVDIDEAMIAGGIAQLKEDNLESKGARLRATTTFEVDFSEKFDAGIAQSVFTHLPINSIWHCLSNVSEVLAPSGVFYATFFRGPEGPERFTPIQQPCLEGRVSVRTFADENPYHYSPQDFARMCENLPLEIEDIGDWGHPRGQQMMAFKRT